MKILLISPLEYAVGGRQGYAGLEELVREYAYELSKEHTVTVVAHKDSIFGTGITLLPGESPDGNSGEVKAFQSYSYLYRSFDAIHDFSHLHIAGRYIPNLPMVNVVNHAPQLGKIPKAGYNIVIWSNWGVYSFKSVYQQKARYLQMIGIYPEKYKRGDKRGDRFLTLGRMSQDKGNLEVAKMCKSMGLKLDIAGGRGADLRGDTKLTEYEQAIRDICDGEQIRFLGEIQGEDVKIKLMQECRALIYMTGMPEVTSHKVQECMMCGAPVIVPRLGGIPEIVTNGINGYLCTTENDYITAIQNVDKLNLDLKYDEIVERYSIYNTTEQFVKLYKEVAGGARW